MGAPTPGMLKWFARANELGQIKYNGTRGLAHGVWDRCMKRAQTEGFVTPNAFGEYELTPAGRAAISSHKRPEAE